MPSPQDQRASHIVTAHDMPHGYDHLHHPQTSSKLSRSRWGEIQAEQPRRNPETWENLERKQMVVSSRHTHLSLRFFLMGFFFSSSSSFLSLLTSFIALPSSLSIRSLFCLHSHSRALILPFPCFPFPPETPYSNIWAPIEVFRSVFQTFKSVHM